MTILNDDKGCMVQCLTEVLWCLYVGKCLMKKSVNKDKWYGSIVPPCILITCIEYQFQSHCTSIGLSGVALCSLGDVVVLPTGILNVMMVAWPLNVPPLGHTSSLLIPQQLPPKTICIKVGNHAQVLTFVVNDRPSAVYVLAHLKDFSVSRWVGSSEPVIATHIAQILVSEATLNSKPTNLIAPVGAATLHLVQISPRCDAPPVRLLIGHSSKSSRLSSWWLFFCGKVCWGTFRRCL